MVMETETNTKYLLIFDNQLNGFKFSQLESRTPVCDSLFEIRLSSFSIFSTESLILAQDERWRRA